MDADLVGLFVVLQPGDVPPGRRRADGDGQVFFFHQVVADDAVQVPQRGVGLGGQHQAFGAAVQPVAQRRGKALLGMGVVFALGLQIGGKGVHQVGVAGAVAVAQKMRRLVQHGKVFILINYGHGRLAARRFGARQAGPRREKLVVDIQFDHIAFGQAGIRFGAFAVDLDALVAERLVHQAARHLVRDALNKTAQAYAVFVGAGGKTFHAVLTCGCVISSLQIGISSI